MPPHPSPNPDPNPTPKPSQVDMCRQAVAAAAAAFGKPGGLSGQARSPPFDPARGGQGGHLPVAPSPFDSQLVHSSLHELQRAAAA